MVIAALAMAGCGGSSKSGSTTSNTSNTSKTPAHAVFVAQLNSTCTRANAAFSAAKTHSGQVAVISHYIEAFKSIHAPADVKSVYQQYISVLEQELAALKKGDTNALFQLAHSKAKPLVKQLGATGCVTGS